MAKTNSEMRDHIDSEIRQGKEVQSVEERIEELFGVPYGKPLTSIVLRSIKQHMEGCKGFKKRGFNVQTRDSEYGYQITILTCGCAMDWLFTEQQLKSLQCSCEGDGDKFVKDHLLKIQRKIEKRQEEVHNNPIGLLEIEEDE